MARLVSSNPLILPEDIENGFRRNQPTVLWILACRKSDGEIVVAVPLFTVWQIAHLVLNHESASSERLQALSGLTDYVSALAVQMQIRHINFLSKSGPEYAVTKFATETLGFVKEDRDCYTLDLNPILEIGKTVNEIAANATKENECALSNAQEMVN